MDIKQTIGGFGYQWNKSQFGHEEGSLSYSKELFFSRYKISEDELGTMLSGKIVLDPAIGSGRVERIFGQYPEMIYAVDLSDAIYAAKTNLGNKYPLRLVKANMFKLPFKDESFDAIICHATLQHTGDAFNALKKLIAKLKSGGIIFFDVYKKPAPIRDMADEYIRQIVSDMPEEKTWELLKPLTELGMDLAKLNVKITVRHDIPFLGIKAGEYDIQRFIYYYLLKLFWHEGCDFENNHLVNFDWYYPKIAKKYTEEEVCKWLSVLQLDIMKYAATEGGIGVIAVKS